MIFNLDVINALVAIAAVVNTGYGLIIYSRHRDNKTNLMFFLLTLAVSSWGVGMFFYRGFADREAAILAARLLYVGASFIPLAFIHFAYTFPRETGGLSRSVSLGLLLPLVPLIIAILLPGGLIRDVLPVTGDERHIVFNQLLHALYGVYIFAYFAVGYAFLIKKYLVAERALRFQIAYILVGTFTATCIGVVTNLVLPFLGIFSLNWVGQVGIVAMIMAISYAILKHHLFDVRVIATELFLFTLWMFILVRVLIANNVQDRIIDSTLFAATVVVGGFLIRSVLKEVEAREQIEKLALELSTANEKLKEVDRLKSEFLSMGTHQLRSPLTAVKGYASLILEGSFGKAPKAIEEAVERIYQSSRSMANTIEDFLTISRIEQNRMKYEFAVTDLGKVVKDVMAELLPNALKAGLQLTYVDDKKGPYNANIDIGKIRQVIINFLDNAMKYTPKGSITVRVGRNDATKKILVSFVDTGVGMTKETIERLFQRFSRATDANKVNVMGTGLGLFVAKEMVTAHKGGRVWAESEGPGKGSQFYLELDAA
ncbi:MAG TPA: ATP-binding protein [Candidatus Paceibacterota bacterium]|nr:ATP-binding protein [Candidatus Paceibacterota bacterium]